MPLTFPQMGRGPSSKKALQQSALNRTRERIMAAAQREFAALLRSVAKWLLLIVAALLIVTASCDEASRALERRPLRRSIFQKSAAASDGSKLE
jgi:hypothetical protein